MSIAQTLRMEKLNCAFLNRFKFRILICFQIWKQRKSFFKWQYALQIFLLIRKYNFVAYRKCWSHWYLPIVKSQTWETKTKNTINLIMVVLLVNRKRKSWPFLIRLNSSSDSIHEIMKSDSSVMDKCNVDISIIRHIIWLLFKFSQFSLFYL